MTLPPPPPTHTHTSAHTHNTCLHVNVFCCLTSCSCHSCRLCCSHRTADHPHCHRVQHLLAKPCLWRAVGAGSDSAPGSCRLRPAHLQPAASLKQGHAGVCTRNDCLSVHHGEPHLLQTTTVLCFFECSQIAGMPSDVVFKRRLCVRSLQRP